MPNAIFPHPLKSHLPALIPKYTLLDAQDIHLPAPLPIAILLLPVLTPVPEFVPRKIF